MDNNNLFDNRPKSTALAQSSLTAAFMAKVYGWMVIALCLTGAVAYYVASTPAIYMRLFSNSMIPIILMVVTFGMVFTISGMIDKLSSSAAVGLFLLYSALMGLSLSAIFIVYTRSSIASTFFICAGMFGAMSLFGAVTKKDLSGMGRFMFMGLIGIIIASIVNIFMKSPQMYWVITYIGVIVFAGLTAYDTQRLRAMGQSLGDANADASLVTKVSIIGALNLYLDFVNLFLMLLRIFGDRR